MFQPPPGSDFFIHRHRGPDSSDDAEDPGVQLVFQHMPFETENIEMGDGRSTVDG